MPLERPKPLVWGAGAERAFLPLAGPAGVGAVCRPGWLESLAFFEIQDRFSAWQARRTPQEAP